MPLVSPMSCVGAKIKVARYYKCVSKSAVNSVLTFVLLDVISRKSKLKVPSDFWIIEEVFLVYTTSTYPSFAIL